MRYRVVPQVEDSAFLAQLKDAVFDIWFNADKLTETRISDALTTTDTNTTTLQLIPLATNTAYHVHTVVLGVESTDRATYELIGTFYRLTGSAVQEGSTT